MDPIQTFADLFRALKLRKARALLFFLLVDFTRGHRTEKILDLLWQDSDADKASASLRQVVHHIRVALDGVPGIGLETGGGSIALRLPGSFALQRLLTDGLAQPDWDEETAGRIRDLIGMTDALLGLSGSFDSWLAITRSTLLSAVRRALDTWLVKSGHSAVARTAAEFALEIEPANEEAVRYLMMLDWRGGHATRAIERYNALYAHLDEAFDQEPEPETVALLAAIKLDPEGGGGSVQVERRPQVSLSVELAPHPWIDREQASFANVLFADLRLRMSQFREWRVVDAQKPEAPQVRVVLRPVASPEAFYLFVEVQNDVDNHVLWSDAIAQPSRDWEAKVRVLLAGIANALSIIVAERSLSDKAASVYDRWLRSQALLDAWSADTEAVALDMLRDITREAPRFGPAHAELAGALNVRHVLQPGTRQTEDIKQTALHHAIEAVSIDPLDTRAHRVLAWCYSHKGEFELAEFHFDQALALNRSNPLTLASCALGFGFSHSLDRAAQLTAEAKLHAAVMQPFHLIYLAAADYLCGDFDAAARQCAEGAGLMTTVGGWHSAALWKLGRTDAAVDQLRSWTTQIASQWRGQGPASTNDILTWFAMIFPLRHEAVRSDLLRTLQDIAERL
jgi:DNA-binding SARP family transcriptional activator